MKLNLAVIFGGKSVEHEISIISALQAIAAVNRQKYNLVPIYISKQGIWHTGDKLLKLKNYQDLDTLLNKTYKISIDQNDSAHKIYYTSFPLYKRSIKIDVVLPIIHGSFGEDGGLQGILNAMNIPYVGCGTLASAIAMDKITTKALMRNVGINVLDYLDFYSSNWINSKIQVITQIKSKFSFPLIVKPSNLGSSIGVTIANNDQQLEDAMDLAARMSQRIMVEPKIVNLREINCAVLGDRDGVEISACEEPIRSDQILSYEDKYARGKKTGKMPGGIKTGANHVENGMASAERKIPADLSKEMENTIKEMAEKAFISLDCNGVARIDFLLNHSNNEIYLCELNTIPGSLSFYLWEPLGKGFSSLIDDLIYLALKRHREDNNLIQSYAKNILNIS